MRTFAIAPISRLSHHRGAQVHGTHQAASHIPALSLPSHSWYSFTDHLRMEGWVCPPRPRVQRATGPRFLHNYLQPERLEPRPHDRKSSTLTTRLSHKNNTIISCSFYVSMNFNAVWCCLLEQPPTPSTLTLILTLCCSFYNSHITLYNYCSSIYSQL